MNERLAGPWWRPAFVLASLLVQHLHSSSSFACSGWRGMATFPNLPAIQSAAELGEAKAQTKLGDLCFSKAEFPDAVAWYLKAADQGEVEAQISLASCYRAGKGVERDPREALRWSRMAAAQGGRTKLLPNPTSILVPVPPGSAVPPFVEPRARTSMALLPITELEGACQIRRASALLFVEAELDFSSGQNGSCLEIP